MSPGDAQRDDQRPDEETDSLVEEDSNQTRKKPAHRFEDSTHDDEVLNQIQKVQRNYNQTSTRLDCVYMMRIEYSRLTHDTVLQALVVTDGTGITFTFMLLAVEVLDSLIVQQAVGMNSASDLFPQKSISMGVCKGRSRDTYHVLVVHPPPQLRTPLREQYTCGS